MRMVILLLAASCAARSGPATDGTADRQLLQMRARMGYALKSLPNYVCLETTERLRAPKAKAKPKTLDTVELEVARVGNKEMYSWPGRNMFENSQMQTVLASGLVGTGAYASQVIDVLFGPGTQFLWVGKEMLGERSTVRWDFTVPQTDSRWTVGDGRRSARVGAAGSVWADAGTMALVRLTAYAVQLPTRFPLKAVERTIDYASVRIGARDVLLPVAVEDLVEMANGAQNINRTRFGQCREYTATSIVSFDTPAAQQSPEQPRAALAALPPNVQIPLALDGHLRSTGAVIGAVVNAHVTSDVRYAGSVLVPKGTPVRGVLRQFAKNDDGLSFTFTLTIEFLELALPGGPVPFRAELKSIDSPNRGLWWLIPGDADMMRAVHSAAGAVDDESQNSMMKLPRQPGVAVLIFRQQESFDLIPGTRMTWITWDDARKW